MLKPIEINSTENCGKNPKEGKEKAIMSILEIANEIRNGDHTSGLFLFITADNVNVIKDPGNMSVEMGKCNTGAVTFGKPMALLGLCASFEEKVCDDLTTKILNGLRKSMEEKNGK
jgi:hypothetical protein